MVVPVSGILFSPHRAFSELKASASGADAILIQLSSWLSLLTGLFLLFDKTLTTAQFVWLFVWASIFLAFYKLTKAMLTHFFAEILGGEGKITDFAALSGYASVPLHFFLPLGLLLTGKSMQGLFPIFLVVGAWVARLNLKALQVNYGLTGARALIAEFGPFIALLIPFFLALLLLFGFFAGIFMIFAKLLSQIPLLSS